ncbi:6-phospho-3-hexuloisomerase [Shouchella shacheensis]|uniref:6-phospho-3-hexuloisomerase n=1 Tax=Shouchella shacheensis TaxID=1649580 RepID=UPI00073FC9F0|nr:6-phospho-3-hexuloisomerase [Shouchella shacheensis]
MRTFKETARTCVNEVQVVLESVSEEELEGVANAFINAKRIFISGDGRSGLMGKAIAMRLMHAGYNVFVTGETITPSIEAEDLLVLISGSAFGNGAHGFVSKAKDAKAQVALVTANPETPLAKFCDALLVLPAATKNRKSHEPKTIQPLGNQFDQSVHVLLDALIVKLTETNQETMRARHANLE